MLFCTKRLLSARKCLSLQSKSAVNIAHYEKAIVVAIKSGCYQMLYGTSSLDKDLQAFDFVVE